MCHDTVMFVFFFSPVKPTVIHTDMFVNSIGPVNAINMVSIIQSITILISFLLLQQVETNELFLCYHQSPDCQNIFFQTFKV